MHIFYITLDKNEIPLNEPFSENECHNKLWEENLSVSVNCLLTVTKCKFFLFFVRKSQSTLSQSMSISLGACKRAKDDSQSVGIVDRLFVFTLLLVLSDLWLHKRLCKLVMKL